MSTNITLLRYRLETPNFRIKMHTIGRLTKTKVAVCFIDGIVSPTLVQEVEDRLNTIDIDGVIDAGTLEQFMRITIAVRFHRCRTRNARTSS